MHVCHYFLVLAATAKDAATTVKTEVANSPDIDYSVVGGIASEDGTDDVESFTRSACFKLSDIEAGEGTYFARIVAELRQVIADPDPRQTLAQLADQIRAFDLDTAPTFELTEISSKLEEVAIYMEARRNTDADGIPEIQSGYYGSYGLTDLSDRDDDDDDDEKPSESSEPELRRYIVMLDGHF